MKFKRLKISDWRQFNEVSIDFHNKVTVITGSNGAGKSTVLRILAKHFSWNCDFLAMPFYDEDKGINVFTNKRQSNSYSNARHQIGEIEYSNEIISSIYIEEHPRTINYDIAIENIDRSIKGLFIHSHRASNNYEITSKIPTGVINAEDSYKNHLQAYKKHLENSSFNGNPTVEMKQSLLSMAALGVGNSYIKKNKKSEKTFTSFIEILKITLPKNIGFKNIRFEVPDVIFETDSGDFVLDSASGGIMSIIDISWQILLYSQDAEHFTALIDEPENHLHPTMQRSLLNDLIKAFPNVQFVIVTHSPFIISSVKDSNVYALKHDDSNKVNSHKLDLEEKASTANKILRDVLGVSITIPQWAEDELDKICSMLTAENITENNLNELRTSLDQAGLGEFYPEALYHIVGGKKMIKLIKLTEPDILAKNFKKWTDKHLSNIGSGINSSDYLKTRYSHEDIKEQLIKETNGKCAYCESKLLHIHHGDVEHIYPKSLDESKRFLWINLTLSCEICNQNKTNLDPNLNNIQDPYSGNPEGVIIFCGSLVLGSGIRGLSTLTILDLNRKQLIEKRQEKLEKILLIFNQICSEALPQAARQAIYNDMIKNETSANQEYSSMVKSTIRHVSYIIPGDIKQK